MNEEINTLNFCEANKDWNKVAEMVVQRLPTPAIIFKLNDTEILKLEPGKFTSNGETLPDLKSVYKRFDDWIKKVENFGKEKETYVEELETKLKRETETPNY